MGFLVPCHLHTYPHIVLSCQVFLAHQHKWKRECKPEDRQNRNRVVLRFIWYLLIAHAFWLYLALTCFLTWRYRMENAHVYLFSVIIIIMNVLAHLLHWVQITHCCDSSFPYDDTASNSVHTKDDSSYFTQTRQPIINVILTLRQSNKNQIKA